MSSLKQKRFCGNCENHVSYEYPTKVFCSTRYEKGEDPVVSTLWHCENWNLAVQECYCIGEALKEKERVRKQR